MSDGERVLKSWIWNLNNEFSFRKSVYWKLNEGKSDEEKWEKIIENCNQKECEKGAIDVGEKLKRWFPLELIRKN